MARRTLLLLAPLALVVFLAVFVGGRLLDDDNPDADELARLAEEAVAPGQVVVWGAWDGDEQEAFEAVLDGYMAAFPGTDVVYVPMGEELDARLREAAASQTLPDMAIVSGTRMAQELAEEGLLQPLHRIEQEAEEPFGDSLVPAGAFGGDEPFGVMIGPRNESLVWYSDAAYEAAGIEPAADWEQLLANAEALEAAGIPAYSLAAAEGATLMDLFENVYLRTAGPDFYDLLAARELAWTDDTVVEALGELVKVLGDERNVAGGVDGALQTDFAAAVGRLGADPPAAAQLFDGQEAGAGLTGVAAAPFPSIDDSGPAAIVTGDQVVMFRYSRVTEDLASYLIADEAVETFTSHGLPSLARDVDPSVYPDPATRISVAALGEAAEYRYDLSDLLPVELASIEGEGLLPLFQDLVRSPDDIEGIAERMEAAAKQVYKD